MMLFSKSSLLEDKSMMKSKRKKMKKRIRQRVRSLTEVEKKVKMINQKRNSKKKRSTLNSQEILSLIKRTEA